MIRSRRPSLVDTLLRLALSVVYRVLTLGWFIRRPRTFGAHAVPLTPDGKLILVRLRYAPGWRFPGGGRTKDEDPRDAVLRELREEIGMTAHGDVELACEFDEAADFKRDHATLFLVRDVRYRPHRWSWEVEQVMEAALDDLPAGLSGPSKRWLRVVGPMLEATRPGRR